MVDFTEGDKRKEGIYILHPTENDLISILNNVLSQGSSVGSLFDHFPVSALLLCHLFFPAGF